jgi:tRNA-specific 2-thiouridylase
MKQLALLMSGGVDSSVAACLLREQGYMVTGIHMKLFTFGPTEKKEESWEKVKEVSRKLGIPCHLLDLSDIFKKKVVDSFIDSYRLGITPNPCVVCNKTIKFGAFFEYARSELKVDYISSGHYARIVQNHDLLGLAKAVDTKKDQSYFLYQLSQPILQNLLLPLGSLTKPEVRILILAKKVKMSVFSRVILSHLLLILSRINQEMLPISPVRFWVVTKASIIIQ